MTNNALTNRTTRTNELTSTQEEKQYISQERLLDGKPDPVDVHIGKRLRQRRILLGLTQEKVAAGLGLAFQQIQKYELAKSRICASRLWKLAEILDVPVSFFYENMPGTDKKKNTSADTLSAVAGCEMAEISAADKINPISMNEVIQLMRAYLQISDHKTARNVLNLVLEISKNKSKDTKEQ